jgi:hypothetical protein
MQELADCENLEVAQSEPKKRRPSFGYTLLTSKPEVHDLI